MTIDDVMAGIGECEIYGPNEFDSVVCRPTESLIIAGIASVREVNGRQMLTAETDVPDASVLLVVLLEVKDDFARRYRPECVPITQIIQAMRAGVFGVTATKSYRVIASDGEKWWGTYRLSDETRVGNMVLFVSKYRGQREQKTYGAAAYVPSVLDKLQIRSVLAEMKL